MTDADIIANTLDGLRNTNDTLRASLHDLEKRHAEAKAALEVARRERDTAEQMLRDCRARCERMKTMEGLPLDECAARQLWAERGRDAALAQAAGLREALKLLRGSCVYDDGELTVPSRYVVHGATAALATPGPTIGEIKAEALMEVANLIRQTTPDDRYENVGRGAFQGVLTIPERLRKLAEKSCLTNGETNSCLIAAEALDEVAGLRARVGELAEERDMWRIRCESPDATPVCVFEGEG